MRALNSMVNIEESDRINLQDIKLEQITNIPHTWI